MEENCVTVGELPKIEGSIGGRSGENGGIFERAATGVFSYTDSQKQKTYDIFSSTTEVWYTYATAKLNFGNGQYHANISPSISAYIWQRIA